MIAGILAGCAATPLAPQPVEDESIVQEASLEELIERYRSDEITPAALHHQQTQSVDYALYTPSSPLHPGLVPLPDEEEVARFATLKREHPSEALDYLDEIFLRRSDLKALAVRDSDGDGIPDYMVSDYFGKFMEGDIDIDGDGVRNTLDAYPYDASNHDGAPSVDANANGVPDHVDLALRGRTSSVPRIQIGLLRDHGILLVERGAAFDASLARAVDDAVRRVFRAYFERSPIMPTLRTLAVEHTALIGPAAKEYVDDQTSAQAFSHTQSLTVYDEGRAVEHDIGLLGLIVHEMGHSYHMALDFDAGDLAAENARTDFPAPGFTALVEPFGWAATGYYDGRFEESGPVMPRFAYVGTAEPVFTYRGKSPEAWEQWLIESYDASGRDPEYLENEFFADEHIIGDYALSSPYEWFGDHFIAYVVTVLERRMAAGLEASGREEEVEPAMARIEAAMRDIWPYFHHRNIAPEILAYFEGTFPISDEDKDVLVRRYIEPIIRE